MIVPILLLAGQSNMVGCGRIADLMPRDQVAPRSVRLHTSQGFAPLHSAARFGPEVGLGQAWAKEASTAPLVILKIARDGSNLARDWRPSSDSTSPSNGNAHAWLYPQLLEAWHVMSKRLQTEGVQISPAGLGWMQGERDAIFPAMARNYAAALTHFLQQLRTDLSAPKLPVVIGRISPCELNPKTGRARHQFADTVREAQVEVARRDPCATWIDTDDLPRFDDLHFTSSGQLELGRRFAAAWFDLIRPRRPSPAQ